MTTFISPAVLDVKAPPQPGKLHIDHLMVDHEVQRSVDPIWVTNQLNEAKGNGFKASALGVIIVSERRDGTHHIIDGQHRVALCREFGYTQPLNCMIHKNLTKAEEALMFLVLNNRRPVQPIDRFKVRVIQGDPDAIALNNLLVEYNWTLTNGKAKGSFSAISAYEKVYTGWGREPAKNIGVAESVLSVVSAAWDRDSFGAHQTVITGLGLLLIRHGNLVSLDKLTTELSASGNPRALVGRARSLHEMSGGRAGDAMAAIMVTMHNKGRRRDSIGRLPSWMGDE